MPTLSVLSIFAQPRRPTGGAPGRPSTNRSDRVHPKTPLTPKERHRRSTAGPERTRETCVGIQTSLDARPAADRIVDAMRLADDLAFEGGRDPGVRTIRVLAQALQDADELVAIAATHALGRCSTARRRVP